CPMKLNLFFITLLGLILIAPGLSALSRTDVEFKIFQFPHDKIPRIDGNMDDWDIVPDEYVYGTDQIRDTEDGHGEIDPKDLDIKVTVGWVKGMNRLYFLYEAYDDFWDMRFSPTGYSNDIFEIAVDGDLSGGPFITNPQIEDGVETRLPSAVSTRRITTSSHRRSTTTGAFFGDASPGSRTFPVQITLTLTMSSTVRAAS
ncbi:hypothetical protein ACFL47_10650, partial [Candidatus Latescibacterota bacterium]